MIMQYFSSNEKTTEEESADPLLYWQNSKYVTLVKHVRMYLTANASCSM